MTLETSVQRDWKWPFWAVVTLSLPSFAALVITICMFVRPTIWAYALVPLIYFYIPVSLVLAVLLVAAARKSMQRYWIRSTAITLALAVSSTAVTIMLVMWAGSKTH
jgi:hypothetical protein